MAVQRKNNGEAKNASKKRRKVNVMRIVLITVIFMISVGLVGSSFLFLF